MRHYSWFLILAQTVALLEGCGGKSGGHKDDAPNAPVTKPIVDTDKPVVEKPVDQPAPELLSFEQTTDGHVILNFTQAIQFVTDARWANSSPVDLSAIRISDKTVTITIPQYVLNRDEMINLQIRSVTGANKKFNPSILNIPIDSQSPVLKSASVSTDRGFEFRFDEKVQLTDETQVVINGKAFTKQALHLADDGMAFTLSDAEKPQEGDTVAVEVRNACDIYGNNKASQTVKVSPSEDKTGPSLLAIAQIPSEGDNQVSLQITLSEATGVKEDYVFFTANGSQAQRYAHIHAVGENGRIFIFSTVAENLDHGVENTLKFKIADLQHNEALIEAKIIVDTKAPAVLAPANTYSNICAMKGLDTIRCPIDEADVARLEIWPKDIWAKEKFTFAVKQEEASPQLWLDLTFEGPVPEQEIEYLNLADAWGNSKFSRVATTPVSRNPAYIDNGTAGEQPFHRSVLEVEFSQAIGSIESIDVDGISYQAAREDYEIKMARSSLNPTVAITFVKPIPAGDHHVVLHRVARLGNIAASLAEVDLKAVRFGGSQPILASLFTREGKASITTRKTVYSNQFHVDLTQRGKEFKLYRITDAGDRILLPDVAFEQNLDDTLLGTSENPVAALNVTKTSLQGLAVDSLQQTLILEIDGIPSRPFIAQWSTASLKLNGNKSAEFSKDWIEVYVDDTIFDLNDLVITLKRNGEEPITMPRSALTQAMSGAYGGSRILIKPATGTRFLSGSYELKIEQAPAGAFKAPLAQPISVKGDI